MNWDQQAEVVWTNRQTQHEKGAGHRPKVKLGTNKASSIKTRSNGSEKIKKTPGTRDKLGRLPSAGANTYPIKTREKNHVHSGRPRTLREYSNTVKAVGGGN